MASFEAITSAGIAKIPVSFKKVAIMANRDFELMDAIKTQLELLHEIEVISYPIDVTLSQSKFTKALQAQNAAFLLSKVTTDLQLNSRLFLAMQAAKIPTINSIFAMHTLDTRKRTFLYLHKHCPEVLTPQFYLSVKEAIRALNKGKKILLKRNAHNIPKDRRFLGVAEDAKDLKLMLEGVRKDEIFLQEYMGPCENTVYKVYFIGHLAMALKSIKLKENAFTARNENDIQERFELRIPLEESYREMGQVLRMNAYGIDYVVAEDGLEYVVDVNDFPSYRGIDEALNLLCDFLIRHFLNLEGPVALQHASK